MIFTERIEKLLAANHIKEVIDEFLKFLGEVPQSDRDARNDANHLRGQVIILSGQFTDLNTKMNSGTIDPTLANREKSTITNSFIQILNQLPSSYPDLSNYITEKNEDDEWKEAQRKNTIEEYQDYFSKYPNGRYKAETIKLITELEEVKQKQDTEIKRLAALEKERREKDKVTEPETPKPIRPYPPTPEIITPAHPKSRAGLYIVIGALIGIIFIIVLAVGASSSDETVKKDDFNASSNGPNNKTESGNEAAKAELKMAFEMANESVINAAFYLNPALLRKSFTGEGLKTLNTRIETLIAADTYMQSVLEKRDYTNIKLSSDGNEGEVSVDEIWSYTYFSNSTKLCAGKQPMYRSSETVYFKKTVNGWMVTSFTMGTEPVPPILPCD
jgi:hypothetical protein